MNKHISAKSFSIALLGATALMAGAAAVLPAEAQTQTAPTSKATQHQSATKPLPASSYVSYAQSVDLFEAEAAKLAVQRAQKAQVKDFAARQVSDHATWSPRLSAAAREAGVTPTTPALTVKQTAKLNELRAASDSAFDQLYIAAVIEAQERELRLHNSYARTGEQAPLRTASNQSITLVKKHIADARKLSTQIASDS